MLWTTDATKTSEGTGQGGLGGAQTKEAVQEDGGEPRKVEEEVGAVPDAQSVNRAALGMNWGKWRVEGWESTNIPISDSVWVG